MALFARPVEPRLCQKLQCGVISPDELTPDVVEDCYQKGYTGTKSPLADECRQYYPGPCQVGPMRAFPDVRQSWLAPAPSVAEMLAAWPAMPEHAVALPPPFDYAAVDSGGVPVSGAYDAPHQAGGSNPGYPYTPGSVFPADQVMQPTTDTGLDQMASALKWPWHVAEDYYTPAAPTPDAARYTTLPAGPGTFLQPLPTLTPFRGVSAADADQIVAVSGAACRFAQWVDQNKLLAVAGLAAAYFVIAGGRRGR